MPIYEYRCQQCGHQLERIQRLSDAPLTDCPACEKPGLKRLVSAAAFRFKGGGWYETDFKKENQRNLAETGSEPLNAAGASGGKDDSGGSGAVVEVKKEARGETKSETGKGSEPATGSESKTAPKTDSTPAKSGAA